jgi:hypothetical protein
MKKKIIVILSAIIIIVSIIIIASNIEIKTYIEIDGNKYYAVVNGKTTSIFPEGNYTVDVDCTNAKGYWDSIKKKIIVKNITGSVTVTVTCDIVFTTITDSDYLVDYIINLQSTSPIQGASAADGTLVKGDGGENDIRYEGKNPYNYVLFNNELWRIIGVFDENSHGVLNTNLVKLIKANSIGSLAWDGSKTNNWVNSSLKKLLNGAYYYATTNTTNCYGYYTTITSTCDYTVEGIQSGYREMIQSVTWYLGGGGKSGYKTYTPESIYGYERNSSAIYSDNSARTTGYIGLMYESDFLYGVLSSSCSRTNTAGLYDTSACAGSDWLYGQGDEWTLSPQSSGNVWYLCSNLGVSSNYAHYDYAVRPVLYLKTDVYRISGTGTISDPYIIGE